jgi:hypothetical protein
MKRYNKILMLTFTVASIVIFWLAPGINKSTATRYTRVFENTDVKRSVNHSDTLKTKTVKVFRKESIKANAKFKDIKPDMFSRAIQFREEKIIIDSNVYATLTDSTEFAYDTLAKF